MVRTCENHSSHHTLHSRSAFALISIFLYPSFPSLVALFHCSPSRYSPDQCWYNLCFLFLIKRLSNLVTIIEKCQMSSGDDVLQVTWHVACCYRSAVGDSAHEFGWHQMRNLLRRSAKNGRSNPPAPAAPHPLKPLDTVDIIPLHTHSHTCIHTPVHRWM